jgi:ribonuclease BN (tRNA processing enzyme)
MRLTVLGRWGGYPAPGGACPGYLLEEDGFLLLIDCGNGILSRLQHYCRVHELSTVILSHLHSDHILDLYPLRLALEFARYPELSQTRLPVLAPEGAPEVLTSLLIPQASKERFLAFLEFRPIDPSRPESLGPFQITFAPVAHTIPTFAMAIEAAGRRLVYSADTAPCDALEELAAGADLFLCEATLREREAHLAPQVGHLTGRMAGSIARRARVRRLLLTHFFPPNTPEESAIEAAKEFTGEVLVSEEGRSYEI